jgi:hypothetical protein
MAVDGDMAGLLPSIKCSNCSTDVEISAMGEHVCPRTRQRMEFLVPAVMVMVLISLG